MGKREARETINKSTFVFNIGKLRPIDDTMWKEIGKSKEVCQEILRTLLEDDELIVLEANTQVNYSNGVDKKKNYYG